MRTGKLPESVLKRSVLRQLNNNHSQSAPFYGADCAFMGETAYTSVSFFPGMENDPGRLIISAVNNLTAAEAEPAGYLINATIPADYEEEQLKRDIAAIRKTADLFDMRPLGGHTQVADSVQKPVYSITGIGHVADAPEEVVQKKLTPDMDLIVTRWIGLSGTAVLAQTFETELKAKYPFSLINRAKEFEKLMCSAADARAITHFGTCAMHDLSQGGILGALREMSERAEVGLEVDLKKIPVKQETIEICEYFDINPYYFHSAGAILTGSDRGDELVETLKQLGIPAVIIGRTTAGKDRIIRNGEEVRYLDRPQQEEWCRKFKN